MGRWPGKLHYIMNDVVWAVDSLFGDTNWHKLQLSSCSVATKATPWLPERILKKTASQCNLEKLAPLGSHAREPAAWEPPLLEILDLLILGKYTRHQEETKDETH